MPVRQPLAGPLGLFNQEPPDAVFEDTVTLWRLSKRPSIGDSLAAMRWIVAAFRDTPGYPAVLAQLSRLEQVAAQGTGALRGIAFNGHLRLIGVVRRRTASGLDVEIAWQSLHDQALDAMNFVHLLDGSSNVTDRLDYPQDAYQGTVKKGTLWRDVIRIPEARLLGARTIGLGVWRPPADVLPIEDGPRDWNGHRLLIAIDEEVPTVAGSPPALRR